MILAIYCAGGLGQEVIEFARSENRKRWEEIIFVDDIIEEKSKSGANVYRFEDVKNFKENVEFVIASGEPLAREKLYNKIKSAGYKMGTIISPWCTALPGVSFGEGCVVYDSVISVNVNIGENVLIQSKASIGHDSEVGAHSILSAVTFLGGGAKIGNKSYIGPGAMIKDRINIGEGSIISLGAVILRNVKPQAIMVGNPAKRIGENTEGKVFNIFE